MKHLTQIMDTLFALIGLLLLCGILTALTPHFLTVDNLLNVGRQISITAIVAVGMTLVIVTAGIDLSVGSVMAFAGCIAGLLLMQGTPPPAAILAGILAGGGCGVINGLLITKAKITPFIATLGMMSIARGASLVVTNGMPIHGIPESVLAWGTGQFLGLPVPIWIMAGVALIGGIVLARTRLGRYAYAMGSNEEAVRLSGVPVDRYKLCIYLINGLLAGLAGIILTARVSSAQPTAGNLLELEAIAAVVIGGASLMGGRGTIFGTIVGAAIMGVLRNGLVLKDVSPFWQQLVVGCVIILAVALDQLRHRPKKTAAAS